MPLKLKIQEEIISKKSGIVLVTLLTYLLSCISLATFLTLTTEMIDYSALPRCEYAEASRLTEKEISCKFDFRESFFDAVSGFTTTGLTAFRTKGTYKVGDREIEIPISKIDAQPNLIHIIRATYLWVGGLGIMFFYLYFTPIPSLMMSMGYEIPAERSLPRFIRLESLSFSLVYVVVTALGILLLFLSISSSLYQDNGQIQLEDIDNGNVMTYSVVLAFSSISTGGFSPTSGSIDQIETEKFYEDKKKGNSESRTFDQMTDSSLLIIMVLMLAGALPIFSLHRPLKFFRRWMMVVAVFLFPILIVAVVSYDEGDPRVALFRSFDTISAFTTTGLSTSQFEEDFVIQETETTAKIYQYRVQNIYVLVLMFIGGAAYSTAGGWGFFNLYCIMHAFYLIVIGKFERGLLRYIFGLVLSFMIFFSIFAAGTFLCYKSGLFETFSTSESVSITDYLIPSAFYEISALSTVGLMPHYNCMSPNDSIYYHNLAYWTLAISMLIGRLYYIIFPFLVSAFISKEDM